MASGTGGASGARRRLGAARSVGVRRRAREVHPSADAAGEDLLGPRELRAGREDLPVRIAITDACVCDAYFSSRQLRDCVWLYMYSNLTQLLLFLTFLTLELLIVQIVFSVQNPSRSFKVKS